MVRQTGEREKRAGRQRAGVSGISAEADSQRIPASLPTRAAERSKRRSGRETSITVHRFKVKSRPPQPICSESTRRTSQTSTTKTKAALSRQGVTAARRCAPESSMQRRRQASQQQQCCP